MNTNIQYNKSSNPKLMRREYINYNKIKNLNFKMSNPKMVQMLLRCEDRFPTKLMRTCC